MIPHFCNTFLASWHPSGRNIVSYLFAADLGDEGLEALDGGLAVLRRAVEHGQRRQPRAVRRVQHVHAHLRNECIIFNITYYILYLILRI